jgi:FMN phosphatase YigB (HAD superfamily)
LPEKTVFVDDRSENVDAALARGWNGIVFESPRQLYLTLMDYGIL